MLLTIDIGNSNIVFALIKENVEKHQRIETHPFLEESKYQKILESFYDVEGVIISSVVPSIDEVFKKLIKKVYQQDAIFINYDSSNLEIMLDNPKEIGADLLATAVGASAKYKNSAIIVDLGTATKFTAVTKDGKFLGGAIAPGINSSLQGLFSSAEKLSPSSLIKPTKVIETTTLACISSGVIYGYASMVDGMIEKVKQETNITLVILTGGVANLIKDYLKSEYVFDEFILLYGLKELFVQKKF